jgi:BirA family transcriptional regulator, biotin operon repressor / biotin---[acetyl-CoA-carboxylase] ligase
MQPESPSELVSQVNQRRIERLAGNSSIRTRFRNIRWVEECTSTNTVLADEARAGSMVGALLIADRQTAGRGRLGRQWETPVGATLPMSMRTNVGTGLQTNPTSADQANLASFLGLLPLAIGLAALRAAETLGITDEHVELKWPNDLMDPVSGRKLAGILCEAVHSPQGVQVIIGIGINVNRPAVLSGVTAERAHWLSDCLLNCHESAKQHLAIETVAETMAAAIASALDEMESNPAAIRKQLSARLATIGRAVRIEQVDRTWEGTAVGLADTGALIVAHPDGRTEEVHAADVTHLRYSNSASPTNLLVDR